MTLVPVGRRYALNAARNLALPCRRAARPSLDGPAYGARPILVLGAGPSMDAVARPYQN
jgi:hypothetical protein